MRIKKNLKVGVRKDFSSRYRGLPSPPPRRLPFPAAAATIHSRTLRMHRDFRGCIRDVQLRAHAAKHRAHEQYSVGCSCRFERDVRLLGELDQHSFVIQRKIRAQ